MTNPLERLREYIEEEGLSGIVLHNGLGLRYFLGFTGSNGLGFVTEETVLFITDFRYKIQAAGEVLSDEIILSDSSLYKTLIEQSLFQSSSRIGFESDTMTYDNYTQLSEKVKLEFVPCGNFVDKLSAQKSDKELYHHKKACEITVSIYNEIIPLFKEGVTEVDIAAEISFRIRKNGGDGDAFEPIVLFGERSALPHGRPKNVKLQNGDPILLDFGAKFLGYCADFSRVLFLGEPQRIMKEIYLAVQKAQVEAIDSIQIGVDAKEVDRAAREVIAKKGFANYFGHATGHGVGLNVHALPRISAKSEDKFKQDHLFTIEPGIYIPGAGGVRIEDTVHLSVNGPIILTKCSSDMTIL